MAIVRALPWLLLAASVLPASRGRGADVETSYLGVHQLGVNRVSELRRSGRVTIQRDERGLRIEGEARQGPYFLRLSGAVERIDAKQLIVRGELSGVPDMRWADEAPRERSTRGTFTFRVTKGRKFWRLYEVDGQSCVCNEGCGNDFCYIDIDLRAEPVRPVTTRIVR